MAAHWRTARLGGALVAAGVSLAAAMFLLPPQPQAPPGRPAAMTQQPIRPPWLHDAGVPPEAESVPLELAPLEPALRRGLSPEIGRLLLREAVRYGLPPELVAAVAELESGYDPNLTHRDADGTYDRGLMQLNDGTSPWLAEVVGIRSFDPVRDAYDPEKNLRMGVWYLNLLLRRYDGDLALALLGYNAGMGTADKRVVARQDGASAYTRAVMHRAFVLGYRGGDRTRVPPPPN